MRIACEHLPDTNRILVRLLGTLGDVDLSIAPTTVQSGTYIVDATPQLVSVVRFDVEAGQIINNEAKIYLSGFYPLPEEIRVTLPDLTLVKVALGTVQEVSKSVLAEQPKEIQEPIQKPIHRPGHADYKEDAASLPEIPSMWWELSFDRTNPLRLGTGITSNPITYVGGAEGRAVSSTVSQSAPNEPPYRIGASTYLEAPFANNLVDSSFDPELSFVPSGFFDTLPNGWGLTQTDPEGLLRLQINPVAGVLPNLRMIYWLRSTYTQSLTLPVAVLTTPSVPANNTVQILVEAGAKNAIGSVRLVSRNGFFTSSTLSLIAGQRQLLSLNVLSDAGPVKLQWFQNDPLNGGQSLTLLAPIASIYSGAHTWIPYGQTLVADRVSITNLVPPTQWRFTSGYIRIDSALEQVAEPVSWRIVSGSVVFLQVQDGILSSDFSSSVIDIRSYTLPELVYAGQYRLKWKAGQNFSFITKKTSEPSQETVLPFMLDGAIPTSFLTDPLQIEISSFSPTTGSGRIRYFSFIPQHDARV